MPTTNPSNSDFSRLDTPVVTSPRQIIGEYLRTAVDCGPIGVAQFDNTSVSITAMNTACMRICGLTQADFAEGSVSWSTLVQTESLDQVRRAAQQESDSDRNSTLELEIKCRDGPRRWVLLVPARVSPTESVAFIVDITERKQMDRALQNSETKLRRIFDSGVVGIFYCTNHREIIDANDKFLQMLGYTSEDLKDGRLSGDRLTPARWAALDELKMAEVYATGSASAWEKELYASDGHVVPVMVAMARLAADTSTCVAICLDITSRRAAESKRERLLGREHAERERAEQAIRVRDEVLAVVAHDLRNPLNTIQLSAGAMADESIGKEVRHKQLNVIERVVADMNHLIGNLLDVARLESGSFPIQKTRIDVRELLNRSVTGFELQLREHSITLERESNCDHMIVACDPAQVGRVLANLLGNAVKYTPPDGRIRLRAELVADGLMISVEDTGPGISEADLPHVFDRFWKASRAADQGIGLGLAIAKGIVESHGGRIWAENHADRGTAFHFTLPC